MVTSLVAFVVVVVVLVQVVVILIALTYVPLEVRN